VSEDGKLMFLPLGGVGEIGLNCYLYGQDGRWMMVDCGIGFADDRLPGAEILLPDLSFVREQRDRLAGLVLTHAHEDHLGAVPYLWQELGCPVWCTAFAAAVLRRKFDDMQREHPRPLHLVAPGELFEVGPFSCRLLHVTHSIPEANALAIDTAHGRLLHTGDWKLDREPLIGEATDVPGIEEFAAGGVLALIGDSTNVLVAGTAGSEAEVRDSLTELIRTKPHRVAVTTFASNVARLETAAHAGRDAGREIVVVGRSMWRMIEAARNCGYLRDLPPLRDEIEAASLPRDRVLYLVTGSQGEPRSALMRIATGQHARVRLEPGDTVIFSSKIIPGNERTLFNLHNQLVDLGVEVITEEDHFVHVSGHPCREDMEQMYRWVRPEIAVPVHGEARHLHAHERFARELGVPRTVLLKNGHLLRIAPDGPRVEGEVPTGRLALENGRLVPEASDLFRARRRIMQHGVIGVGLVLDNYGSVMAPPTVANVGAVEPERFERLRERLEDALTRAVEALEDDVVTNDERVREAARVTVRQTLALSRHKRPVIEVLVTRLTPESLAAFEDDTVGVR
jgi:Predicted hydrolase of the metallo-beta-lactamase superfamily